MAIIAVLVAVSIPLFSSKIRSSQETVCLSNRRNLQREMLYAISIDEISAKEAFDKYKADAVCTSNGKISYYFDEKTMELNIYCYVHTDAGNGNPGSVTSAIDLLKRALAYSIDNFMELESPNKKASVTKELQKSVGAVALSADEQKKVQAIGSSKGDMSDYFWIPTYSSSGEVMMVATKEEGKSNPQGSLIYYDNNYYYFYGNPYNKIGQTYIADNGFDESKLNPNVTTPTGNDTWVKMQ